MSSTEPYYERLRRLRHEAGLSQPQLYRRAEDVGLDTIRALERPYEDQRDGRRSRSRYPSADTLEKLAAAIGVTPAEFPEYRLARARELLDERAVGLEEALAHLEAFDEVTATRTRHETEPASAKRQRLAKAARDASSADAPRTPPEAGGPAS